MIMREETGFRVARNPVSSRMIMVTGPAAGGFVPPCRRVVSVRPFLSGRRRSFMKGD
jgi:hypothetical protein